jgi:hypothetical protein
LHPGHAQATSGRAAGFALLVADRGWTAGDYVDRAVPSILAEVVSPGD